MTLSPQERAYTDGWRLGMKGYAEHELKPPPGKEGEAFMLGWRHGRAKRELAIDALREAELEAVE